MIYKILTINLAFVIFSSISIGFIVFIHMNTNTIYNVFSLIVVFVFSILNLFVLGVEFLSYILFIIYVGAIALLFLFVIMMLNPKIDFFKKTEKYIFFDKMFFFIVFLKGLFLCYFLSKTESSKELIFLELNQKGYKIKEYGYLTIDSDIFRIIFTDFWVHFLIIGVLLLFVLIAALILTMNYYVGGVENNIDYINSYWMVSVLPLQLCFLFSFVIFFVSLFGFIFNTENFIKTLIYAELLLFSISFNYIIISVYSYNPEGQIIAMFITCLAASESVLGLGLLILNYKVRNTSSLSALSKLKK